MPREQAEAGYGTAVTLLTKCEASDAPVLLRASAAELSVPEAAATAWLAPASGGGGVPLSQRRAE